MEIPLEYWEMSDESDESVDSNSISSSQDVESDNDISNMLADIEILHNNILNMTPIHMLRQGIHDVIAQPVSRKRVLFAWLFLVLVTFHALKYTEHPIRLIAIPLLGRILERPFQFVGEFMAA